MLTSIQLASEIGGLCRYISAVKAKTALEIGAGGCGTSVLMWAAMGPDSLVVSVDLPEADGGTPAEAEAEAKERMGGGLTLIRGKSQAHATVQAVKDALGGRKVDLLFIDSEHSMEQAMTEYRIYKPMLSEHGMVAFHDITIPELWAMWCGIRGSYPPSRTVEFIESPVQKGCGIGLVLGGA